MITEANVVSTDDTIIKQSLGRLLHEQKENINAYEILIVISSETAKT